MSRQSQGAAARAAANSRATITSEARAGADTASGWVGRRWSTVRHVLLAGAIGCVVAAVALQPDIAARFLSGDGVLEPWSRRVLMVVEAGLLVAAAALGALWRRWRVSTPTRELAVLGAGALAASVVLSAVAAEIGLTVIHRFVKPLGAERHYFFAHDPVLGWKHRPRSTATFKNALVRIDADGFRVTGTERGPFTARVLLLGDSQAFGDGVAAEDTFGARLEASTSGLRVFNASVIGYGTDQQLLYFEQHVERLGVDVTVVALNAYDLRDNLSTRVRSGYAKPRFVLADGALTLTNVPVPGDAPIDRLQREIQHRSHLCRLAWRLWRNRGARDASDDEVPAAQRLAHEVYPDDAQVQRGFAVTAAILDRFASRAAEAGSRLIVLFLPYELDFRDQPAYSRQTDSLVEGLRARASDSGYTLIDARGSLAGGRAESLFLDSMHLSPAGHERVAAALAPAIAGRAMDSPHHAH